MSLNALNQANETYLSSMKDYYWYLKKKKLLDFEVIKSFVNFFRKYFLINQMRKKCT